MRDLLDTTFCDKVCHLFLAGRWVSPVSTTNTIDHHDITEILVKVALNTITLTLKDHHDITEILVKVALNTITLTLKTKMTYLSTRW